LPRTVAARRAHNAPRIDPALARRARMPSTVPADLPSPRPPGARVFISYAHVDEALRAGLRAHLTALEREGLVRTWDDRDIDGGDDWAEVIETRLNQADVILLLVSADFINSQYCYGKELARALERNADPADRAIVIPIILRSCAWQNMAFGHLQALPTGGRPLAEWKTPDDYYTAVTQGLRKRLKRLIERDSRWIDRVGRRLRDPLWWQQPRVWASALAAVAIAVSAVAWWRHQAAQVDRQVALALQDLRSGRAANALNALQPLCRALVRRDACFVLQKSELGAQLEQPDALPLEAFGTRVKALRAQAPEDPDLLLYAAQLVLLDPQQATGHAQARADIERAIALAGGRLPEAHYYLANLEMLAGRHAEALPWLDRALDPAVNPVAPEHYLNARAYARARTGDLNGAQRDYELSAERGSILSRIELAELLWTVSAFDRASDQLQAAHAALIDRSRPLAGRNALPWAFETEAGHVVLKQPIEKHCFARWMHRAGLALAERAEPDTPPTWADCGPEATRIATAVAAALARASGAGMDDGGRARALDFAQRHRLR
jgi:hypothetical protein